MNKNLPMIRNENIFTKIKRWFRKLLGKDEVIIETVQEITENATNEEKEDRFRESLKVKSKDVILFLQKQLESNQIRISDLTDEQMDEMIELLTMQIKEQKKIIEKTNIIKE